MTARFCPAAKSPFIWEEGKHTGKGGMALSFPGAGSGHPDGEGQYRIDLGGLSRHTPAS